MPNYLENLTIRLATGAAELDETVRRRHAEYLRSVQRPDGGFAGREGDSDLYYSGFALRSLSILGELYGPVAERAAAFLKSRVTGHESVIDLLSLVYGAAVLDISAGIDVFRDTSPSWRDEIAGTLEQLRRDDGGYAKTEVGQAGSTYYSFLVLLCLELIGRPRVEPQRIVDFILSQEREEGGFRDIRVAKRPSTNPTAAAIGVLRILDALDNRVRNDTIDFLVSMQTDEGGLRANTRIPIADLLSTFTGVSTLVDLDAVERIDSRAVLRYVRSLEHAEGGFRGAAWDEAVDVEYTFYGLGCLALLRET
jgi:geranylgeranyl transferase type-2 subunit beta